MTTSALLTQENPRAEPSVDRPDVRRVVDAFHRLYYDGAERTWLNTHWLGVPVSKCPLDLWVYQELVYELRPDVIVECGTYKGGSALYLASLCDLIDHGRVYSVDVAATGEMPTHPRVEYLCGSSVSPRVLGYLRARIAPGEKVLVVLDSDHSEAHVRAELELYSQLVTPGSYLILEDTNVNGHPVLESHGRGPMEALDDFLRTRPGLEVDREREKFFLTFNPRGYLRVLARPADEAGRAGEATRPARSPEALAHRPPRELPRLDRSRDSALSRALRTVGRQKEVLLLGGGDGAALAAPLTEQECRVVLLEPDPRVAARLGDACDRVVVDDPSGPDWERELGLARFDAIVAVDVLERLEDPPACLRRLRRFLRPDGVLVASVRNVAHGDVRLSLLGGVFEPDGPSNGHAPSLRRFTRQTAEVCVDDGGFAVRTLERVHRRVTAAGGSLPDPALAGPVARWLAVDEDATTSELVITATPLRHGSERALRARIHALVAEAEALRQELGRAATADGPAAEAASLLDLRRQIARRDALLEQVQAQLLRALADHAPLREAARSAEDQLKQHHDNATHAAEEALRYAVSLRAAIAEKEEALRNVCSSRLWRLGERFRRVRRRIGLG